MKGYTSNTQMPTMLTRMPDRYDDGLPDQKLRCAEKSGRMPPLSVRTSHHRILTANCACGTWKRKWVALMLSWILAAVAPAEVSSIIFMLQLGASASPVATRISHGPAPACVCMPFCRFVPCLPELALGPLQPAGSTAPDPERPFNAVDDRSRWLVGHLAGSAMPEALIRHAGLAAVKPRSGIAARQRRRA